MLFFISKHSNKSIMKEEKLIIIRIKKRTDDLAQTYIVSKN